MELLKDYFPFWNKLTPDEQSRLSAAAAVRYCPAGTILQAGTDDCIGLVLVTRGRLRVYISSEEGKEITLYRLLERDMCLFSASCMMNNIQFDISVQAEEDTDFIIISPGVYKELMDTSLPVARYTNELMSSRFSDVMWLMDQVLNKRLDSRLAALLLEEAELSGSNVLTLTHEQLGSHLGTAREVVTRMLKYFQSEGLVRLARGSIELIDIAGLESASKSSRR